MKTLAVESKTPALPPCGVADTVEPAKAPRRSHRQLACRWSRDANSGRLGATWREQKF